MSWISFAGSLIQVLFIIFSDFVKNKQRDKEEKDALKKEWDEAVKSGDHARINAFINRLRQ